MDKYSFTYYSILLYRWPFARQYNLYPMVRFPGAMELNHDNRCLGWYFPKVFMIPRKFGVSGLALPNFSDHLLWAKLCCLVTIIPVSLLLKSVPEKQAARYFTPILLWFAQLSWVLWSWFTLVPHVRIKDLLRKRQPSTKMQCHKLKLTTGHRSLTRNI